jgi:hypothetical protein
VYVAALAFKKWRRQDGAFDIPRYGASRVWLYAFCCIPMMPVGYETSDEDMDSKAKEEMLGWLRQ